MYIEKKVNSYSDSVDIKIYKDDIVFSILYGRNYDLYWIIENGTHSDEISFEVTPCDSELLYEELDKLYKKIASGKIMGVSRKNSLEYKEIFKDGVINWISDDRDCKNIGDVSIPKKDEAFDITLRIERFKTGFGDNHLGSIRFRTSGSAYYMFYIPFKEMYDNLCNAEMLNQITIKQYCKQKKISVYPTK